MTDIRLISGDEDQKRPLTTGLFTHLNQEESLELQGDVVLMWVLWRAFGRRYCLLAFLKLLVIMLGFAGPLLLNALVAFMEEADAPLSTGAYAALGLFLSSLLASLLQNVFDFQVSKTALATRTALVSAVYGKALRAGGGLAGFTLGEVVNLMSTDSDRVVNFFKSFHELWSMPVYFAVALYLLYLQVGVAFLGGLGAALLMVPFNKFLASRILSNNKQMLSHKDSRVKVGPAQPENY